MAIGDPLLVKALGRVPPGRLAGIALSMAIGRPRSLASDALQISARLHPPAKVEGLKNIPSREPFLLVANHYQAPQLWIGLVALVITAAVARARERELSETHWMLASEWGQPSMGARWVPAPLTGFIFPRAAQVWGGVALPANPVDVRGRAIALRHALSYLGQSKKESRSGEPVALFPEGTATVQLQEAKPGSGAFIHRVSALGVQILPVGVHDDESTLVVRFGEPFRMPSLPPGGEELDEWARREVMSAIGRLLPEPLWGVYTDHIRASREDPASDSLEDR